MHNAELSQLPLYKLDCVSCSMDGLRGCRMFIRQTKCALGEVWVAFLELQPKRPNMLCEMRSDSGAICVCVGLKHNLRVSTLYIMLCFG